MTEGLNCFLQKTSLLLLRFRFFHSVFNGYLFFAPALVAGLFSFLLNGYILYVKSTECFEAFGALLMYLLAEYHTGGVFYGKIRIKNVTRVASFALYFKKSKITLQTSPSCSVILLKSKLFLISSLFSLLNFFFFAFFAVALNSAKYLTASSV